MLSFHFLDNITYAHKQKILMEFYLSILFLFFSLLVSFQRTYYQTQGHEEMSFVFFYSSVALALIFRLLIHFELISVYSKRQGSDSILL